MSWKKISTILLLSIVCSFSAFAGKKIKFPVSEIPKELLKNADAVVRMKNDVLVRKTEKHSVQYIHYALTVLRKSGKRWRVFRQPYYRYTSVSNIKGTVYNAAGEKVESFKLSDVIDMLNDFESLFTDSRQKMLIPNYDTYPYTVEYSCEVDYSGTIDLPPWQVVPGYNVSIQNETFKLITPGAGKTNAPLGVKYFCNQKNIPLKVEDDAKGNRVYALHMEHIQAYEDESFSPYLYQESPVVYFAPVSFNMAGFEGGTRSWNEFASFIRALNKNRDELPKETVEKIKEMAAAQKTWRGKVDTLYRFMQDKVRYVNISKGIQGWQPMAASKVDAVSYGDCKALTNYMKSVLKAAGIQSYYTLVHAGRSASPILANFPSNQFNHAILCVPNGNDTIWLENTSQHIPPGYLGAFTDDREVLVIKPDTVKMVRTPFYNALENSRVRNTAMKLAADGTAKIQSEEVSSGLFYDRMFPYTLLSAKKQRQAVLNMIHLPTFDLNNYSYKTELRKLPVVVSSWDVLAPRYATTMGNMMFFQLYPFHYDSQNDFRERNRKFDIVLRRSESTVDSVVLQVPKGYVVAKLPANKSLETKFGSYQYKVLAQSQKVILVRKETLKKGNYPADQNDAFFKFQDQENQYDGSKIVLRKQN